MVDFLKGNCEDSSEIQLGVHCYPYSLFYLLSSLDPRCPVWGFTITWCLSVCLSVRSCCRNYLKNLLLLNQGLISTKFGMNQPLELKYTYRPNKTTPPQKKTKNNEMKFEHYVHLMIDIIYDSQPQVIKFTSLPWSVALSEYSGFFHH